MHETRETDDQVRSPDPGTWAVADPFHHSRRAMCRALILGAVLGASVSLMLLWLARVGAVISSSSTQAPQSSAGELAAFGVTGAVVGMIFAHVCFRAFVGLRWLARRVSGRRPNGEQRVDSGADRL